jgi:hypothetical protein
MNRTTDIIIINSVEKIPALDTIRSMPREQTLKLIFEKEVQNLREAIGQQLRANLKGFYVGIHTLEPEIRIAKLITDLEIEENQDFFEQCAKDYRALGEELIDMLVDKLDLKLNKDFPLETFNQLIREQKGNGTIGIGNIIFTASIVLLIILRPINLLKFHLFLDKSLET